jgi:thiamine-monophosphate kinase
VAPNKFVKRSGAQPNDLICVSGELGGAFLGLTLLEREKKIFEETGAQPDLEGQAVIVGRLLKPEARKDIIDFFAEADVLPTGMIDVSDGLSSDIMHICQQSQCGCILYEDKFPFNEEAKNFAYKLQLDPTACALSGGEDYELLFTVSQQDYDKIKSNPSISVIGYITPEEEGQHLITRGGNKHALVAQGWNHLQS